MNIEEIQEQCESLSNEQLVSVVNNKRQYTEGIVGAAYREMKRRGLSKEEFKELKRKLAHQSKMIRGDIREDILLLEKIVFFFLFLPRMHFLVLRDYRKRGYVLKIRQAGYYNFLGAVFFSLDVFLGMNHISFLSGAIIWALSFLPVYAFNEYYFKQRTIKRLEARIVNMEAEAPQQNFYP